MRSIIYRGHGWHILEGAADPFFLCRVERAIGPNLVANLPAQHFPQRLAGRLGLEVPQRHINGRMRQTGDAGAAHPLQRRIARQFLPQARDIAAVFTDCPTSACVRQIGVLEGHYRAGGQSKRYPS